MSKYIKHTITEDEIYVYNTSDWHVGSLCFHEDAARELVQKVRDERAYLTFGGDALEGKPTKSNHFDPHGLDEITIDEQVEKFVEIMAPIADRLLMVQMGNHELYLLPDHDVVLRICERLGRPELYGHYQTWVKINNCTMHFWHGRPTMPRGAKDPIQREANQKAWLKNKLHPLAGSAQAQYMGHTHHCMIVEPIQQYALLDSGENVHGEYFKEEVRDVNGMTWVPPDARWYVNTGTLRRGGGFEHQDYSEIAGYTPPPIACTKTVIADDRILNIQKVML